MNKFQAPSAKFQINYNSSNSNVSNTLGLSATDDFLYVSGSASGGEFWSLDIGIYLVLGNCDLEFYSGVKK